MTEEAIQGDDRSITIEKDAISSAIISGNGNRVVIYQYQIERQVKEEQPASAAKIGSNPYKGLLAFQEEDGDRYFGREDWIERLWKLFRDFYKGLTQEETPLRLLPILGPSGCGKSSLARAGLIPELARRPLPGKSQARVAVLVPGTHPLEALAGVLARIATNDQTPVTKTREFAEELKQKTEAGAYDGLRRIADMLPEIAASPLVVLVDQFEEVYSLCDAPAERKIFIENLVHAAADRSARVSVLITLRSDFLGETQNHSLLNQVIAKQGVIIPAMSEDELRRAITKPAELADRPLDEATVNLLIEETEGREGALPLLQFALTCIWDGLTKGFEPAFTLQQIGGVGGALAGEAQRIFESLNDEEKEIARRVFLGLVQLGEGTKDTRRRAAIDSLVSHRDNPERVKKVIAKFAHPGVRLITLSSIPEKGDTAEVTHEALFDRWDQLKKWLDTSRDDIRFQRRLDEAALYWNQNGHPNGSLWRPPDLDLLRAYHKRASNDMTPLQVKFFNASKKAENTRKLVVILGVSALTALGGLVWQSQQQYQQQEQLIQVLQFSSLNQVATPEIVEKLIKALNAVRKNADRLAKAGKVERALANYNNVRSVTNNLQQKIKENLELNLLKKYEQELEVIFNKAEKCVNKNENESCVVELIRPSPNRLSKLEELEEELKNGRFGVRLVDYPRDFEKQFTEGALRTTYEVLMRESGAKADTNDTGELEDSEASMLPCDILWDIEKLWRKYTKEHCGWYGPNNISEPLIHAPACNEKYLGGYSLTRSIFSVPFDLVEDRLKICKISPKAVNTNSIIRDRSNIKSYIVHHSYISE